MDSFPTPDSQDYVFLTVPGASVRVHLHEEQGRIPELQIVGNREGLLSLANILLWLLANSWRRELLSLTELAFVSLRANMSLVIRITTEDTPNWGLLNRQGMNHELEWQLGENDLTRVALTVHNLACKPDHIYDLLPLPETSYGDVRILLNGGLPVD